MSTHIYGLFSLCDVKFCFITKHRGIWPVAIMCGALFALGNLYQARRALLATG
jgi:hypothetical protein